MVLHTQTPPPPTSPPHTPPTQLTPLTPPEPITSAQLARIAAYYEARKPYLTLLYETMDDNITANTQDTTEKHTNSDKQKEEEEESVEAEPKTGAHFGELVAQLKEARIANAAGGKKVVRRKL